MSIPLLLLPLSPAHARVLVTVPRRVLALMPLAIIEDLARTTAGRIGPILEGPRAGARWDGVPPPCTPGHGRHLRFLLLFGPSQERGDLGGTHLGGVAYPVEEDVAFDPVHVRFLGAPAIVAGANSLADTVEETASEGRTGRSPRRAAGRADHRRPAASRGGLEGLPPGWPCPCPAPCERAA